MSKSRRTKKGGGSERRISVRGVRRDPADLRKLSQALIALSLAEQAARDEHEHGEPTRHAS